MFSRCVNTRLAFHCSLFCFLQVQKEDEAETISLNDKCGENITADNELLDDATVENTKTQNYVTTEVIDEQKMHFEIVEESFLIYFPKTVIDSFIRWSWVIV